jgi:hypothetical protein
VDALMELLTGRGGWSQTEEAKATDPANQQLLIPA